MTGHNVEWSAKKPVTVGLIALLLLVGGFGAWSVRANIAGAIIATGKIEVEQNRQVIQHPDGGVVESVNVREGGRIEAGDLMIQLDETRLKSQLLITESQLFELIARSGRLVAERDGTDTITFDPILIEEAARRAELQDLMDGQERLFRTRIQAAEEAKEQLVKQRSQTERQIEGIASQQEALERQLAIITDELTDQQSLLDQGLAQRNRVLSLQREEAGLSGQVGELKAQLAQNEVRITEIDLEIIRLETTRKEEAITQLRDIRFREYELREQRLDTQEQLSRLNITAPVSGLVFGLTVFAERSVVTPAEPLLYIVPDDRPLVITGQIEPIHIDEVFQGQDVTLRFSTFDARSTPEVFGIVSNISGDVFTDEVTGRQYYRVEMTLNEGERERLGEVELLPGMPVEGYIRTSERTPMSYLVKPLADYFNKAFRES